MRLWHRAWALVSVAPVLFACGDATGPGGVAGADIAFAIWGSVASRGLYIQSIDSGSSAVAMELDRGVTWLDWSPDGESIAYSMAGGTIRVVAVEDKERAYALLPSGGASGDFLDWSPDGTWIAYAHDYALWIVEASGGTPKNVSQHDAADITSPEWSPDGTRILYEWGNGLLWIADANGTTDQRVPIHSAGDMPDRYGSWGYGPRWSPDGQRIVYHNHGVWTVASDGSDRRAVTPNCDDSGACGIDGYYFSAQWSPSGTRLVFSGRDHQDAEVTRIYIVDVDGTGFRSLTDGNVDEDPQWSPDESLILFSRTYGWGKHQLRVIRPDGTGERAVTPGSHWHALPRWRPRPGK
jgi:Tol biopolymer transport system component